MHYILPLLSVIGIHLLAAISPGPAFVATLRISASNPRRTALLHSAGLGLAAFTWAAGAMVGMQALMIRAAWLYRIVELAGGLYLAWIGIKSWRHAKAPMPVVSCETTQMSDFEAIRAGYFMNIANPKVMVFFASIFAAMLPPVMPLWSKLTVLFAVGVDEGLWFSTLAILFSTRGAQMAYRKAKTSIDRTVGCFMLLFGGKLSWNSVRG